MIKQEREKIIDRIICVPVCDGIDGFAWGQAIIEGGGDVTAGMT